MRHPVYHAAPLPGVLALSSCNQPQNSAEVKRAIKSVNVIDESNLSDIMLTVGDPKEAVAYFQRSSAENPDRIDLKRGLAKSLIRAGQSAQAVGVLTQITASPEGTNDDRVALADALIRTNDWTRAEAELNRIPPTHETFERYRPEAMVADRKKLEKSRQFLRNRRRPDHQARRRAEQLGLFQAVTQGIRRRRKTVHAGANL